MVLTDRERRLLASLDRPQAEGLLVPEFKAGKRAKVRCIVRVSGWQIGEGQMRWWSLPDEEFPVSTLHSLSRKGCAWIGVSAVKDDLGARISVSGFGATEAGLTWLKMLGEAV